SVAPAGLGIPANDPGERQGHHLGLHTYQSAERYEDRGQIRQQFRDLLDEIEPIVRFLTLVMQSTALDSVLGPGDQLPFHQLLGGIEEESAHRERLQDLARSRVFSRVGKKGNTKDRLEAVLDILVQRGYLVVSNQESSLYTVTGKIEHFYRTLEFLHEHGSIPLIEEGDAPDQEDMAL
ncbi:hypothetical protein P8631_08380, partial [Guyparkeria sp. 1SP6A2]|nr:hypothetical protein [Guyparkeria sp. 1SP6A2]